MQMIVNYFLKMPSVVIIMLFIMLSIAFLTLSERKILGLSQMRLGPNKNFYLGLIQPIIDALKLLKKHNFLNFKMFKLMSWFTCCMSLLLSLFLWYVIPFSIWANESNHLLFLMLMMGLISYMLLMMGWSSTNKYGYFGANRGISQILSFEIGLSLLIFLSFIIKKSMVWKMSNLSSQNMSYLLQLLFFFMILLEAQRSPLDLSEGESELVSGYNTEYSSLLFIFIFLSEYSSLLLLPVVMLLLWLKLSLFKLLMIIMILTLIRSCFPRLRYDILMSLVWLKMLPILTILWLFYINI